jgi:hypothetical protein
MSRQLPAVSVPAEVIPGRPRGSLIGRAITRSWTRSPFTDAVVDAAPDLLRLAGRVARSSAPAQPPVGLPSAGANGLSVSEVEIDVASPLVRRIVVRTTNAWSVSSDVALAQRRRRPAGRLGLGALSLASLALLGLAAARRGPLPLSLPDRLRSR